MTPWDMFWDIAWRIGLPFAMTVAFIWALYRGWFIRSGEVAGIVAAYERELKRAAEDQKRIVTELEEWKFLALRGTDMAELLTKKVVP